MAITLTPISSPYRYTSAAEVSTYLDSLNYTVHTDADRDGVSDAASAAQGILTAEARVDLHTGGPYTFAATTAGTIAAQVFNGWSFKLAAYELAAKRGFRGLDRNEFERVRDEVLEEMRQFREGELLLVGAVPPTADEDASPADTFQSVPLTWAPEDTSDEDSE